MPELLQQAGDSRPIAAQNLRRAPPAVPQAQRGQTEGHSPTSSREQCIIPTVTTINSLDDLRHVLDC